MNHIVKSIYLPLQPTFHTTTFDSLLDLDTNIVKFIKFGQYLVPGICKHNLLIINYSIKLYKFKPKIIKLRKIDNYTFLKNSGHI